MKLSKLAVTAGILAALALPLLAAPAHAGKSSTNTFAHTFRVNSPADEVDANIGDGKCKSTPSNKCTLRAAIQEANADSGEDLILLRKGSLDMQISGLDDDSAKGDFDIRDSVTIRGRGADQTVIEGNDVDRIFQVVGMPAEVNFHLEYVTLHNGSAGGQNGGGMFNSENAWLDHVVVSETSASYGGALYNAGNLHVSYSNITKNAALGGGGLLNNPQGTASIVGSTFTENGSASDGGGISNYGGSLFMVNSTVASNYAYGDGGGLYNRQVNSSPSYLDLRSVTVSRNTADYDLSNGGNGGGVFNMAGATAVVFDTVIAQNVDKSLVVDPALSYHDCGGELTEGDYGYNLLGVPNGCSGLTNGAHGDKVGTSNAPIQAKLNDLANNGGPTQTMLPASDSPVVDAGDPGGCGNDTNGIDQRDYVRKAGANCDMGAAESNSNCAKPSKPLALTPYFGQIVRKPQVKLSWLPADCAATYRILIREEAPSGDKVLLQKDIAGTSFKTPTLEKGHTYYWRIQACNPKCSKSAWYGFIVKANVLP